LGANQVYKGWGTGGTKGAANGALGGSAMAAGLYQLGATNPYLLAAVVATSVLGNAIKTGKSVDQTQRDGQRSLLQQAGVADRNFKVNLADGSTFDIGVDGHGQEGTFRDPSKLSGNQKDYRVRRAWDVDYTNDLDFAASMGAIGLSRLLNGGKGKAIDQMGGQLTNAVLGKVGNGKDMTKSNFDSVMSNLRGVYSQSGIKSKAEGYALANQAYAEGRIDESDLVSIHQGLNMMYDRDGYNTAQKLMSGRNRGVEVAASMPEPKKPELNIPTTTSDSGFSVKPGLLPKPSSTGINFKNATLSKEEIQARNRLRYKEMR